MEATQRCVHCQGIIKKRKRARFCSVNCRTAAYGQPVSIFNSGVTGAIGELRACADLLVRGYEVFRSVAQSCSCDLMILKNGKSQSVEVRTGWIGETGFMHVNRQNFRANVLCIVTAQKVLYEGLD